MTLVYLACGWLIGIALAKHAAAVWWQWLIMAGVALAALIIARRHETWRTAFACLLLLFLGAARYSAAVPHFDEHDLAAYNDQGFVTIEGMIADAPDRRDTYAMLRVRAEKLIGDEGETPVEGLVLVEAPVGGSYRYGDPVRVRGELISPPELDTFSYRDYLARQGVYSLMRYAQVEVSGDRQGNPIRAALLDFREQARIEIARLLPDPQASLLAGILLGIETGISADVREAFNATGATHVIAISGSNMVILAGLIQSVCLRLIKKPRVVAAITIAGVLGYAVFVGGDAAVMRAAIMTTLGLVATQLYRQTFGLASLSFSALLMTAINPLVVWDVGFQLSFLATLGLILYVEPLQNWLEKGLLRVFSESTAQQVVALVSDAFVVTVAAQITTTPIMAYTFERFSLVSLPVNFLIIPAQTPLMVLGGIGVLAGLIFQPLGQIFAWGSWVFLTWTLWVVRMFARLPNASLVVEGISPEAVWGIYLIMLAVTVTAQLPDERRQKLREWINQAFSVKVIGGAGAICAVLVWIAAFQVPDGMLNVTTIDAGDAPVVLVETPSGRQVLIDAGGSGRKLSTALGDSLPFWDRRIDLLIVTQTSRSHVEGLPALLERYQFDAVMAPITLEGSSADPYLAPMISEGVPVVMARPGMPVSVGDGVTLMIVDAPYEAAAEDESPQPVSVLISYGQMNLLLPGEGIDEAALIRSPGVSGATILVTGRSTAGEEFLAAVDPQIVVWASGEAVAGPESTAQVYRPGEEGIVQIRSDGGQVWIRER
ncbi:MAG: ComEC/Rec2 family competence protein [Anaerolineae bacterium]|nr:ComEC/Rec2 family competence protein [Anaerolineae bacterium]